MIVNQNELISYINGYLDALSDISGKQREFYIRLFLLEKNENAIEEKIKKLLDIQKNIKVVDEQVYSQVHIQYFLEKLILFKPFSGLYTNSKVHNIPDEVVKEYQDYIVLHLSDYVDFALEGENIAYPYKSDMSFILLEEENKLFIVLVQKVEDRELIWVFWQYFYSQNKVKKLFLEMKNYCAVENKKKLNKKKTGKRNYLNGLSEEVNEKLASLLSKIIEKGYIEDDIRSELLKHISLKEISELEDVIFKN